MLNGLFVSILFAFSPYHVNLSITYIYVLVWCRMNVVNMLGPRSRLIYCSFAMYWNGSERIRKNSLFIMPTSKTRICQPFRLFPTRKHTTQHNRVEHFNFDKYKTVYSNYSFFVVQHFTSPLQYIHNSTPHIINVYVAYMLIVCSTLYSVQEQRGLGWGVVVAAADGCE